ncbi:MAG TPA: M48 family metalloprotease [Candidatus Babeliales bacterium]|nr:M48 family metalloprotease [Candidatus Babeliales bacterium]
MVVNKRIILLMFLAAIGIGSLLAYRNYTQTNRSVSTLGQLALEEQNAWRAIESLGISKDNCYKKAQKIEIVLRNEESPTVDKTLSENTRAIVNEVLRVCGINPETISLIVINDAPCAAGANNDSIAINPTLFESLPIHAQKFVIAHEAQHIIHKDSLVKDIIMEEVKDKSLDYTSIDCPVNQLSRFFENRADILAALLGKDYAKGYQDRAELWVKNNKSNPGTTHPKHETRLALAQEIYSAMQTA